MGASDGMVQDYIAMFTVNNEGMDLMAELDTRESTPTSFEEWCRVAFKPLMRD